MRADLPPFFVIGNPRSGTTLLRLMLTCHPNLCVPPESPWLVQLHRKFGADSLDHGMMTRLLDALMAAPKFEQWGLDPVALRTHVLAAAPPTYRDFADLVYRAYAAQRQPGSHRWGDKNTSYVRSVDLLARLFPGSLFIHLVRDGRDVACSYRDLPARGSRYEPQLPRSVAGSALDWTYNEAQARKGLARLPAERSIRVRYEDLVQSPRPALTAICSFLGESFDEAMLQFDEQNRALELEPRAFLDWKQLTTQPLTQDRVNRWRREMFDEDQYLFDRLAGRDLDMYGYERAAVTLPRSAAWLLDTYARAARASRHLQPRRRGRGGAHE